MELAGVSTASPTERPMGQRLSPLPRFAAARLRRSACSSSRATRLRGCRRSTRTGSRWVDGADSWSLARLHDVGIKHPSWVRFWEVVSAVFGPTALRLLGAVAAVVALVQRKLRVAMFLVVSIEFSELATQVAKSLAD